MGTFYRDGLADHRILIDALARSRARLCELHARTSHPALGEASDLLENLCRAMNGGARCPSLDSIEAIARRLGEHATDFEGTERLAIERAGRLLARVVSDARALEDVVTVERPR